MADELESSVNTGEMPFVAPWYWLSEGFAEVSPAQG